MLQYVQNRKYAMPQLVQIPSEVDEERYKFYILPS